MSFQKNVAQLSALTESKINKNIRMREIDGQVRDLEGQVYLLKAQLVDTALDLYSHGEVAEEDLKTVCAKIADLNEKVKTLQGGNMSTADDIRYAKDVLAWKAGQQKRLIESSNRVQGHQRLIVSFKSRLADTALTLSAEGRLTEEELKIICAEVVQLSDRVEGERRLQNEIKNEQPPPKPISTGDYTPDLPPKRLVCPTDGKPLPVGDMFCMEHGAQGVPAT